MKHKSNKTFSIVVVALAMILIASLSANFYLYNQYTTVYKKYSDQVYKIECSSDLVEFFKSKKNYDKYKQSAETLLARIKETPRLANTERKDIYKLRELIENKKFENVRPSACQSRKVNVKQNTVDMETAISEISDLHSKLSSSWEKEKIVSESKKAVSYAEKIIDSLDKEKDKKLIEDIKEAKEIFMTPNKFTSIADFNAKLDQFMKLIPESADKS